MRTHLFHRLTFLRGRRRKWLVALACGLGCITALALACFWYNAAATEEDGPLWTLDDLRSVRGPRDLWDFITGDAGRRRREIRSFLMASRLLTRRLEEDATAKTAAAERELLDELQSRLLLQQLRQAERRINDPATATSPAKWNVQETEFRAVLWLAEWGIVPWGEPVGARVPLVVGNGVLYVATLSKLDAIAVKE
jgi:hypothetical protein